MDFGAPKASKESDAGKMVKLAQRVEEVLNNGVIFKEPKQLDPRAVLVSPVNRDGAPPNVQYIHNGILKNFVTKGFDRTRPLVGICVEYKSPEGKKKLLEHNKSFTQGCSLLPAIDEQKALYGSLAGSHLNLALRLIQSGASSPAGDLGALVADDTSLKEVVSNGHRWWILPEDVPLDRQVDISLWRNQDQNDNQGTHEIEILQSIVSAAEAMSGVKKTVQMGDLVAKASKRNPAKISPSVLNTMAKFFVQFLQSGDQHLLTELVDFHSMKVNPRDLVVSNNFFQILVSEGGLLKTPYVRHYLLLTQYTLEKTRAFAGSASVASFLDQGTILALVKKADTLQALEQKLRELRDKYLPILEQSLSTKQARLELSTLMDLVIRCILSKPWPDALSKTMHKVPLGKFSAEKVQHLAALWAKTVDLKFPEAAFSTLAGLALPDTTKAGDEAQEVDLTSLKVLKRNASDSMPDDVCPSFKRGDEVTVTRRMSWTVPLPDKPDFRKNIEEGMHGVVEGWADLEKRKVLLKVNVTLPGGPRDITHEVFPRNIMLTTEYDLEKAKPSEAKAAPASSSASGSSAGASAVPEWLLKDSDPSALKIEAEWTKHLADNDNLSQNFWLRSRVGMCLEALYESLPTYTDKDLLVCHRQNKHGVWKDEVWTKRAFAPQELVFAPLSSQVRETHLTATANVILGLPKHGRGSHPENLSLAVDGRGRACLAKAGSIDGVEHKGSLFWLVQRTSTELEANMTFESTSFENKVSFTMPNKKRKTSCDWSSTELPTVPLLVNKKAVPPNKLLAVFMAAPPKKETAVPVKEAAPKK